MFYIITEDKKMGAKFWEVINAFCLGGMAKVVRAEDGIGSVKYAVERVRPVKGDVVYFAIDRVSNRHVRSCITWVYSDAGEYGYSFKISDYFCIEELFLSFSEFSEWLHLRGDALWLYSIIRDYFRRGSSDYWLDTRVRSAVNKVTTREQCAAALLNELSQSCRKGFWIHKDALGDCWYKDCTTGSGVPFMCSKSDFECFLHRQGYNFSSRDKLLFFWRNSQMEIGVGSFSDFVAFGKRGA